MDTNQKHEQLTKYTMTLVHCKARQLVGKAGYTQDDIKDIEQDLIRDLLERLPKFDPAKATLNTFAVRVVEGKISKLLRDRQAEMRDHRREAFSMNEEIETEEGPMERHETIGQDEIDLRTGAIRMRADADGKEQPWKIRRSYGCGPMAGGLHLVTFRSGCAGFFDLAHDGGTANLGGFRAGCTPNLIPADGVLCAPDYTRTCVCRYQNRSSLALVHMPDAEYWTFGADFDRGRMGLNFGAPGDRRAPDGTLWRAAPCPYDAAYGGKTLFAADPASPKRFVRHSSRMRDGEGWKWVGASGAIGLRKLTLPHPGFRGTVTVKLYFAEPVYAEAGTRVFSVDIDGRRVLADLDIVKEARAPLTTIVRELSYQPAEKRALELTFTPQCGEPLLCGLELIEGP